MVDTSLTDPLGRAITLHDRTWFGHIVKGHPEVADCRDLAEHALRQPQQIRLSATDPDCRKYLGPGPRDGVKILVIADVAEGLVKTAYLTKRPTGDIEWP
ncbi:MAG: hypothetical protein WD534_08585 [Phycisphaeraceae bacterium]